MTRLQCSKCPWKCSTDPRTIPRGYSEAKHEALRGTIAEPGVLDLSATMRVMACHETHAEPCVGWLANQLGPGNNIALRIRARQDRSLTDFKLVGEQHETFEDTLPRKRRRRSP